MRAAAWVLVVVGTLAGVGLGYLLRSEATPPVVGGPRVERLHQEVRMLREQLAAVGHPLPPHLAEEGAGRPPEPADEALSAEDLTRNAERLAEALLGIEEGAEEDALRAYAQRNLLEELSANPEALRWALRELETTAGSEKAAELSVVLGMLADPEVEARALAMARTGSREQRLLGLELLDRLDIENPDTRAGLVAILRTEQAPDILGAALYALHPAVVAPSEAAEVRGVLSSLSGANDPELRRRSLIAVAQWAAAPGDLQPLLGGLQDPHADVRAGAAFALSQTRVWSPASRQALSALVGNPDEDPTVRELAWHSLGQLPQDAASFEAWSSFRELRAAAGEAGP